MKTISRGKEKLLGATGSVSGAASVLGSWQVCHNVCLGIVALLGALGIAVSGMPLLFLTKVAAPLWIAAALLLGVTLALYTRKRCISGKLLVANAGLVIAGVPFKTLEWLSPFFWITGGMLIALAAGFWLREKFSRREP